MCQRGAREPMGWLPNVFIINPHLPPHRGVANRRPQIFGDYPAMGMHPLRPRDVGSSSGLITIVVTTLLFCLQVDAELQNKMASQERALLTSSFVAVIVTIFLHKLVSCQDFDLALFQFEAAHRDIRSSGAILSYAIDEQLPVGSLVADLSRDVNATTRDCNVCVSRFLLLGQQRRLRTSFSLNSSSGVITTSGEIDRELICFRRDVECVVVLDVAVQTKDIFDVFRVEVETLQRFW